jgi:hypothetical protein
MGTTTREMGPGSRHDTLDDVWGYWNWLKLTSLCRFVAFLHDNFSDLFTFSSHT